MTQIDKIDFFYLTRPRYKLNQILQAIEMVSKMNISKDHLEEFDRLVQLLESPGFSSLRFELLNRPPTLLATLQGLLMILPQVSPNYF